MSFNDKDKKMFPPIQTLITSILKDMTTDELPITIKDSLTIVQGRVQSKKHRAVECKTQKIVQRSGHQNVN